jgi:MoxR-like ATPase
MTKNLEKIQQIVCEVQKVIKGKNDIIEKILEAILAKGHILIEDIPGVGKTTLAMTFAKVMDLEEHRMQFTPDVLPTDVVGFNVLNKDQMFEYKAGAILCNLFLADEINRTSSKTQSALLEVMEEGKVTVDGITRVVPQPFVVIATQNPVGSVGTQMLPESQLDRFMVKLTMGYPDINDEINILKDRQKGNPMDAVQEVVSREELIEMQRCAKEVYIHDKIYLYIAKLITATRENPLIQLGISPRGTIAVTAMAKARAFIKGRNYVLPEDVSSIFKDVCAHRLILSPKARVSHITVKNMIEDIIRHVPGPKVGEQYVEK